MLAATAVYLLFISVLPTDGRSSDLLTVGRCRSHCVTKLRNDPSSEPDFNPLSLNDESCKNIMDCNICWDLCYNLADDWDKWNTLCVDETNFCPKHPGCGHACSIMIKMSPTSEQTQRVRSANFVAPSLAFRAATRQLQLAWAAAEQVGGTTDIPVSWVFFQEQGQRWQPLLQTLNTSIQIHIQSPPHAYSFCVVLVDRHGLVVKSPVVKIGRDRRTRVVQNSFQFPSSLITDDKNSRDPLQNEWQLLKSALKSISHRIGTQSNLTRLVNKQIPELGRDRKQNTFPLFLTAGLAILGAVVLVLVGVTCYFQRYQSKQLAAMRSSFHVWTGRLGSSFRSTVTLARHSFRRRSARAAACAATATESGDILTSEVDAEKATPEV